MLKEPRVCSCFMVKTPLKLMRKSMSTPLFFISLILLNFALLTLFILPCKLPCTHLLVYNESCTPIFVADYTILFVTLTFFILAQTNDPGYLKKPDKISFLVSFLSL